MQVFPPGWTEGLSTNALVATEASRICSLRPYSTAFSLQASFFSWQFFSPHQSLLFSYVVSSFYEDRSAVTPPCPPSRAAPGSQRSCRSEEGSQGMEKAMQEEGTKQYHIPSLTSIHKDSGGGSSFPYSIYTQHGKALLSFMCAVWLLLMASNAPVIRYK